MALELELYDPPQDLYPKRENRYTLRKPSFLGFIDFFSGETNSFRVPRDGEVSFRLNTLHGLERKRAPRAEL